jgi:hypothetical protein
MKKLILLLLVLILTSCGARKVDVSKIEIKKDSIVDTKVIVTTTENKIKTDSTNVITKADIDEITFTPVDSSKEIVIEGKRYKNVVLKVKKSKTNSLYTNKKKQSDNKHTDSIASIKAVKKEVIDGKTKDTDKKESIVGNIVVYSLLLLFWVALALFVRKMYKTYIA